MGAQFPKLRPLKPDGSSRNLSCPFRQKPQDGQRRRRLSGPRLSHQPQSLPFSQGEADSVYSLHRLHIRLIYHGQILDLQYRFTHCATSLVLQFGIQGVGKSVTHQIKRQGSEQNKDTREKQQIR